MVTGTGEGHHVVIETCGPFVSFRNTKGPQFVIIRRVSTGGRARDGLGRVADECRHGRFPGASPADVSIAYRMLGSVGDAEDIVQEAFVRYYRALADGTNIKSTKAFLSAVTTRLSIDQLRSARVRRETYVGQWLPSRC